MIVHPPEIEVCGTKVRLSARMTFQALAHDFPDRLWIEVPNTQRPAPCDRGDAFGPALLHLAMVLGEPLELRGTVCPRLLYGLREYQEAFLVLFPDQLRRVPIRADCVQAAAPPAAGGIVCQAFSGGVDSFHTLRHHSPHAIPGSPLPVTHALLVHGFDVPLGDERTFREMERVYGPLLAGQGVQLLTMRTNLREITGQVNWEITHGAAIAFAALALGPEIRSVVISSTQAYHEVLPWGSDPRVDYWLATQRTEMIHYGAHLPRMRKLLEIADWEPARQALRVCWERPNGLENCCRCSKCLRTMACLKAAGQLQHFSTFPLPYDRRRLRRLIYKDTVLMLAAGNLLQVARHLGDAEVASDVAHTLRRSQWRRWVKDMKCRLAGRGRNLGGSQ